ncbi:transposable element Tcb2 transposase [Trichonephila clavipes]|nr:transposable element Tcb2 transposase [Trichonephila clavipes]
MPGKRARRHFSQLSEFERGLIIGMKTAGWSTCRVAVQLDRSECAFRNCWEQWTRKGTSHCPHSWCNGLGAIAYDSRSTLIVMRGNLTGQRYVDDIHRPHVGPFLNGFPGTIFQQDNARPHTASVAQDFLRHFQTLPWPARSPDFSPVENVWDQLKRQLPSCHSVHDLELSVQDLWAHLPQDNIRCLINSMPDRVAACIAAGGGPTRY